MTLTRCCLGIAVLLLATPIVTADENRVITVTGTATVHYLPDAARVQFRVRSSEATLEEARQASQKALKLVDEKLSALKIKDMKIAFAAINAAPPRSRFGGGGEGGFGGPGGQGGIGGAPGQPGAPGGGPFGANRNATAYRLATVIVRDTDLDKLADAIGKIEKTLSDAAIVGPATPDESGISVSLFRREDAEFRDEALTKAVQNALQKANALAKGAGLKIKETVSIIENTDVAAAESPARAASRSASVLSTGELEITVRVTVKCSY